MSDETQAHLHKLGESCADCDESRRLLKAQPVEITAVCDGRESKLTVPLWMYHTLAHMAREHAAQTPGVQFDHRQGRSWQPIPEPDAVEAMASRRT